jgi:4-amino-4-deoxy-L-arabinose transferase-like glycosyltransferase
MRARLEALARRRAARAVLLAAALADRLAVVASAPPQLLWPDGRFFEAIGWQLASEGTYGDQTLYAPGYPTLIAAVYRMAGRDLVALRVVEAALSAGTVALVGVFGAAIFSPGAGLAAAALAGFHPVMVVLPITHYAENLILFLSALALGAFALTVRRPSPGRWLLCGGLFGLLALTKPNLLALLPGLALGAWIQLGRDHAPRLVPALLFAAALGAVVAPWLVRNHGIHQRWYAITTGGGRQFWLGNNPQATGASHYNPTPPPDLVRHIYAVPHTVDRERVYYREAWRWVRENPGRALQLYLRKMGNLWALVPRTATRNRYTGRWEDWAQGACSGVVFLGAALGLARVGAHGVPYLPLAVASFTLMNSAFLMVMRYRMSFEVALLWLAGAGYVALLGRTADPPRAARPAAPAV